MTVSAPDPIVSDADRRRDVIAAAAARLFDERGYASTSMRQIADAVEIAKPTLYHYFRSKDAILFQIHEEFIDILLGKFAERSCSGPTHRDALVGAMGDILSLMESHRGHVRAFFEHHRELPVAQQELIRDKRDRYEGLLVELLREGARCGELEVQHPRLTALGIFGMCNWAYQWYSRGGPLRPVEIAEQFGAVVLGGIARS
ncbi:hypothetical protein AD017_28625 (plasmid) [Pseudonocardia sp. EC080619-01]|uniref:TetR/AcrR family transcriptional regulator n=1 Tax=Pseudonocardia sp. EC080619-01 TaxID=1096856 RepID=UPI0007069F60|nr:TetR/AcrR family transcriptional regulator [Pseudonocardia sp. EC080619-01]ALL85202.1 hypothetical protein AD017_28625 [Pseudonocardia sp. EC080619-01]